MIKTKTGIEIPEKNDRVYDTGEAIRILLEVITKMAKEVDKLSDEIDLLKLKTR